MIKVKAIKLFAADGKSIIIDRMNNELEKFLSAQYKNTGLKYDIQNRIGKAAAAEIESITGFRNKLIEENGIGEEGLAEANKRIMELLNRETELNANPVPLSSLLNEDCSELDFNYLDDFILDDRGGG